MSNIDAEIIASTCGLVACAATIVLIRMFCGDGREGRSPQPVSKKEGVSTMKWKMIKLGLLLVVGGILGDQAPAIFSNLVSWYKAPPAPYSQEATNLIESLQNCAGWQMTKQDNSVCCERGGGTVYVTPHTWHANVFVGAQDVSDSFTYAERRALNRAAESAHRKLVVAAIAPTKMKEIQVKTADGKTRTAYLAIGD